MRQEQPDKQAGDAKLDPDYAKFHGRALPLSMLSA
jgi:hypothetical protein